MKNPALGPPIRISPTRVELGARCHRRHLLADFLHLRSFDSPAAAFGKHLHAGVAAWWHSRLIDGSDHATAYASMIDCGLSNWSVPENKYQTEELLRTILDQYAENAKPVPVEGEADEWVLMDIERRASVTINMRIDDDPDMPDMSYVVPFTLDRVYQHSDTGELLIIDTKSSARMDAAWAASMRRSIQQRIYNKLARIVYGVDSAQSWIEGINKRGKDVGSLRYEWVSMSWTDSYVDEAMTLANQIATADLLNIQTAYVQAGLSTDASEDEMEQALRAWTVEHSMFNYGDCRAYNFDCPYMPVCDAPIEERVGLLGDFRVTTPWFQED